MPRVRLVDFLFKVLVSLFFIGHIYVNLWAKANSERGQVWEGLKFFTAVNSPLSSSLSTSWLYR